MATASDNFAGTGPLSANWTVEAGAAARSSGVVIPSSAPATAYWTGTALGANQYVELTIPAAPASGVDALARVTVTGNGYGVAAGSGVLESVRFDAGVAHALETLTGYTLVAGDRIGVAVVGSSVRIWYNHAVQGTGATDATYSAAANTGWGLGATGDHINGFYANDSGIPVAVINQKRSTAPHGTRTGSRQAIG